MPGLSIQLKGMGGAVLDETIARAIHAKRGSGESLDPSTASSLGKSMGHDFSDVNIHRDQESDHLNKSVQAEAFTTGKDIFFREGKYDPVSNEGQKLLAHELTHVVQQRDAPPASELRVSDPHEPSEQQASSVADKIASPGGSAGAASSVGREEEEVDRHAMRGEEEEKRVRPDATMNMSVEREAEPEEEEGVATMVAREAAPGEEEEGVATMVAREAEPEEDEGVATMVARDHARGRRRDGRSAARDVAPCAGMTSPDPSRLPPSGGRSGRAHRSTGPARRPCSGCSAAPGISRCSGCSSSGRTGTEAGASASPIRGRAAGPACSEANSCTWTRSSRHRRRRTGPGWSSSGSSTRPTCSTLSAICR